MKSFSVLFETTFAISTVQYGGNDFNFDSYVNKFGFFGKVGVVFESTRCTFAPIYLEEIHRNRQSINLFLDQKVNLFRCIQFKFYCRNA